MIISVAGLIAKPITTGNNFTALITVILSLLCREKPANLECLANLSVVYPSHQNTFFFEGFSLLIGHNEG